MQEDFLEMWLQFLSSHSRSPQLLDSKHPVVVALAKALEKYTLEYSALTHFTDKKCVCVCVCVCVFVCVGPLMMLLCA